MSRRFILRVVIVAGMMLSALSGLSPVGAAPVGAGSVASDAPGVSIDVPASWWAGVQEEIRRSEYQVSRQEGSGLGAAYQAPNRAHNLRTYFEPEGIRVVPRTEEMPSWRWGLRLTGYGREEAMGPVAAAEMVVAGNRVAYERGELTEWYVNDERGLEQGFTLSGPPVGGGSGWLALEMALTGDLAPRPAGDGSVEFVTAGGVRALRYGELRATDALGRRLPARLEVAGEGLRILVDDAGAEYPLSIDPLTTSPAWSAEGDQAGASFGYTVGTAGDVNGDGYADVLVGASGYDSGVVDGGRALLYCGSPGGLGASPAWTAEADVADAVFGVALGTAGDVNGDGYADVVVGAPGYYTGTDDGGRAFVYYGSASGLSTMPDWVVQGTETMANLGIAAATAGDVNGDGYADIVIGAMCANDWHGAAYVYHGSEAGLSGSADWVVSGEQREALFGHWAATAGDVNGDGYADIIVSAPAYDTSVDSPDAGRAYLYLGSSTGLTASSAWTVDGQQSGAVFGWQVGTAGDVNGDGFSDVIVGEPMYDGAAVDVGRVHVYHGSASGLSSTASWTAVGDQAEAWLGFAAATAGDVNGDGYADVVVGAYSFDNGDTDEGRASLYYGSPAGLSPSASWTAVGDQPGALFGFAAGTAGDVNGDGYADVIVGTPYYDGDQVDEGQACVYYGSASGPAITAGWSVQGEQEGGMFAIDLATAGDVNGDGYADVIVGGQGYDNGGTNMGQASVYHGSSHGLSTTRAWTAVGQPAPDDPYGGTAFGRSVAAAGDVNGDGYDDVIIGAPAYDNVRGRAYVYHGSASGLSGTPAWTAGGDVVLGSFGWSVGTAGDVNGDGYADVIVGATGGWACVYLGSPAGLATVPAWRVEGEQQGSMLGQSVGTAGDVNGDGFSDVIVGAPTNHAGADRPDAGRAYVYLGSASGLATSPAWTADGEQPESLLGWAVGTAGDVNGDGYADIIVSEPKYDGAATDAGRVHVYHGSATGLDASANWTIDGEETLDGLGDAVGTGGDVNGDGYADVVVGAIGDVWGLEPFHNGRASVYLGSRNGLATSAAWALRSDQAEALYGHRLGTAGDVNGDGYAEVVVGEPGYDGVETNQGRALVYYGNGGPGLSLAPRQLRADGSGPIAHLGSAGDTAFRLALLGRSPFGRGKVKLQWEVKPVGTPFDGSGLGTSSEWMDSGTAGAALDGLVAGLAVNTAYHWRVRLLYHPASTPFQQYSRWLTQPWNGWQEARLRSLAPISADLSLGMTVAPDPAYADAPLTYTVSVSNAGPGTADGVSVALDLPQGAGFLSAGGTGWTCQEVDGVVTCGRDSLAPGDAPAISVVVNAPPEGGPAVATAEVSAATEDPYPTNNSASVDTTVTAQADLALGISDTPDPVCAYAPVTYTLSVSNVGPSTAEGIVVTATVPSGTGPNRIEGAGWVSQYQNNVITCTRDVLAPGDAPPIAVTLGLPASWPIETGSGLEGRVITTTARVSAATEDPILANNVAVAEGVITQLADLSLRIDDSPDPVHASAPLTYTLIVHNDGPCTVTDLSVVSDLPAEATFVSASGEGWQCVEIDGVVRCDRPGQFPPYSACATCEEAGTAAASTWPPTLPPGEEAPPITIVVTAPSEGGRLNITGQVSTSNEDPNPGNDAAGADTTVIPYADLALSVADTPDPVYAGASLTYTVTVANAGVSGATSVVLAATLPVSSTFVSAGGWGWECTFAEGIVTCRRAGVPAVPGGWVVVPGLTIVTLAPETRYLDLVDEKEEVSYALISAGFAVSAAEEDPEPGNNQVVVETTVRPGRHSGDQK